MTNHYFVSRDKGSQRRFRSAVKQAVKVLDKYWWPSPKAYVALPKMKKFSIPSKGEKLNDVLEDVGRTIIAGGINPSHPRAVGHMHCLPTVGSAVTELLLGATNQSLDSWDESPVGTHVEQALVRAMCDLVGFPKTSDAVIDSGGTMSNQTGVLIARDWFIEKHYKVLAKRQGMPARAMAKMKIFCSEEAHFSIEQSAAVCGLGADSVVKVPVKADLTMDETLLGEMLAQHVKKGNQPFLVVATAGTTNAGNIPNLKKIGALAKKYGAWYHVDGAFGGALLFSRKYRRLISGIELADSITIDPHKLLYQSISCGLFLLKNGKNFKYLTFHSDYLSPESDKEAGVLNLVDHSLQTTRRFDALKFYVSLRHMGKQGYDQVITATIDNARWFAGKIKADPELKLATAPQTNIVLLRYVGDGSMSEKELNQLNDELQEELYKSGEVIFSRTKIGNVFYLKATCMNPITTRKDFETILKLVKDLAHSKVPAGVSYGSGSF